MRGEVFDQICKYVEETFLVKFDGAILGYDSNLFEKNVIDSYGLVDMIGFLERSFGIEFSDAEMISPNLVTLNGITEMVQDKLAIDLRATS
jgi:acyl carrier protein